MINVWHGIGNLGSDPESRTTGNGTEVANFNIATTDRWKGQDGQMQEKTSWHKIVAWGKLAGICSQYLSKGSRVYISGSLEYEKWTNKDGVEMTTAVIKAREMKMLSPKGSSSGQDSYPEPPPGYSGTGEGVPF